VLPLALQCSAVLPLSSHCCSALTLD
jgi:hypothetical protein